MRVRRVIAAITLLAASGAVLPISASAATPSRFGDGGYTVGRDIDPGIYSVNAPLSGPCTWALRPPGHPGVGGVVSQWQPEVSLRAGDYFESYGCGTWVRIG